MKQTSVMGHAGLSEAKASDGGKGAGHKNLSRREVDYVRCIVLVRNILCEKTFDEIVANNVNPNT